jgi:hypothetical protein
LRRECWRGWRGSGGSGGCSRAVFVVVSSRNRQSVFFLAFFPFLVSIAPYENFPCTSRLPFLFSQPHPRRTAMLCLPSTSRLASRAVPRLPSLAPSSFALPSTSRSIHAPAAVDSQKRVPRPRGALRLLPQSLQSSCEGVERRRIRRKLRRRGG